MTGRLTGRLYLTPSEAAPLLGIRPDSVRARLRRGTMPGRRFGRDWKVLASYVREHGKEVNT